MKIINLSKGKVAYVDDADFEWLSQFKWNFNSRYARKRNGYSHIFMHRFILGDSCIGKFVDHKDGNALNNQRGNLRLCDSYQNSHNRIPLRGCKSKYKGVTLVPRKSTIIGSKEVKIWWRASIKVNGKLYFAGQFRTEIEAAKAYNDAAIKFHKDFARLNILQ